MTYDNTTPHDTTYISYMTSTLLITQACVFFNPHTTTIFQVLGSLLNGRENNATLSHDRQMADLPLKLAKLILGSSSITTLLHCYMHDFLSQRAKGLVYKKTETCILH